MLELVLCVFPHSILVPRSHRAQHLYFAVVVITTSSFAFSPICSIRKIITLYCTTMMHSDFFLRGRIRRKKKSILHNKHLGTVAIEYTNNVRLRYETSSTIFTVRSSIEHQGPIHAHSRNRAPHPPVCSARHHHPSPAPRKGDGPPALRTQATTESGGRRNPARWWLWSRDRRRH